MVLISFKTAKTKKHIANFRFSYQIQSVVHYVDYLSEDITQGLFMFLASKRLRLPISSERNPGFALAVAIVAICEDFYFLAP